MRARGRIGARGRIEVAVALSCALGLSAVASAEPAAAGPRRHLLALINEARVAHDVRPVRLASRASRLAERHSERMARAGRVFSSGEDYPYRHWGEDVSCGRTIHGAHRKILGDPVARRTLLGPRYRRVGIGIATTRPRLRSCRRAAYWVTEVFFRA
jgi:uncharacterized protein YkwD